MKLYYAEILNARKVCAVAKYLDAPVEYVRIDMRSGELRSPAFLAINPNGKVPALVDGDIKLWESSAIMAYLSRAAKSYLWPDDDRQFEVLRWLSWDAHHFGRQAGELYFQNIVKPMFGLGEPDAAAVDQATGDFRKYARVLDDHLTDRGYLVGNTLTIADFVVAASLPYAGQARIPLRDFSEIERWHARLNELPAWREPYPAIKAAA